MSHFDGIPINIVSSPLISQTVINQQMIRETTMKRTSIAEQTLKKQIDLNYAKLKEVDLQISLLAEQKKVYYQSITDLETEQFRLKHLREASSERTLKP